MHRPDRRQADKWSTSSLSGRDLRNGWQPTADALLTMRSKRQLVAASGNGLALIQAIFRRHLEHVLHVFIDHYNPHRPHRALKLKPPAPSDANVHARARPQRGVDRRDRLGGLIHEYHAAA